MRICPACRRRLLATLRASIDVLEGQSTAEERALAASVVIETAAQIASDARFLAAAGSGV
jgi:hypothetical protein